MGFSIVLGEVEAADTGFKAQAGQERGHGCRDVVTVPAA